MQPETGHPELIFLLDGNKPLNLSLSICFNLGHARWLVKAAGVV